MSKVLEPRGLGYPLQGDLKGYSSWYAVCASESTAAMADTLAGIRVWLLVASYSKCYLEVVLLCQEVHILFPLKYLLSCFEHF